MAREEEILQKLEEQSKLISKLSGDIMRIKRYFFWSLILGVAFILIPLILAALFLPQYLNNIFSVYGDLLK